MDAEREAIYLTNLPNDNVRLIASRGYLMAAAAVYQGQWLTRETFLLAAGALWDELAAEVAVNEG